MIVGWSFLGRSELVFIFDWELRRNCVSAKIPSMIEFRSPRGPAPILE